MQRRELWRASGEVVIMEMTLRKHTARTNATISLFIQRQKLQQVHAQGMGSYLILVIPENQQGLMPSLTRVSLIGTPQPLTTTELKSCLLTSGAVAEERAVGHGIR